jgi:hypothetical protein
MTEKQAGAAGRNLQDFARDKGKDDKLHCRCLEEQQQEKKAEQLGEYF